MDKIALGSLLFSLSIVFLFSRGISTDHVAFSISRGESIKAKTFYGYRYAEYREPLLMFGSDLDYPAYLSYWDKQSGPEWTRPVGSSEYQVLWGLSMLVEQSRLTPWDPPGRRMTEAAKEVLVNNTLDLMKKQGVDAAGTYLVYSRDLLCNFVQNFRMDPLDIGTVVQAGEIPNPADVLQNHAINDDWLIQFSEG